MKKIIAEYIFPLILAGIGIVIPKDELITNIIGYSFIFIAVIIFLINLFKNKSWFPFKNYVLSAPVRRKTDHEIAEEAFNEDDK